MNAPGFTVYRWTEAEDAVIREHYPVGGAAACTPLLPAYRNAGGIIQRASQLKVSAPTRGRHPDRQELEAVIRTEWAELSGGRGDVARLAQKLEVPRWWLSRQLLRMGLVSPHKKEPDWTAAEEALLETLPLHDPRRCSRIFAEHGYRRSPAAIMVRATRLKLSRRATHVALSAGQAAEILGMDSKTLGQWCDAGEVKAERADDERTPQQGGHRWNILPADLRAFVVAHPERVDLRKVDRLAFIDLLGAAPAQAAPAPERRQSPVPGWTPEKLDKSRRLFGMVMIEIAWALNVPPKELLEFGLNGVIPPNITKPPRAPRGSRKAKPAPMLLLPPPPPAPVVVHIAASPDVSPAAKTALLEMAELAAHQLPLEEEAPAPEPQTSRQRGFWTEERVAELRRRAKEGETSQLIADTMQAPSRSSVCGAASRNGIKLHGVPQRSQAKPARSLPPKPQAIGASITPMPRPAPRAPRQFEGPRVPSAAALVAKRFRLEASPGVYLHEDCSVRAATTPVLRHAWQGTAKQLAAVQARFPETAKFIVRQVIVL